MGAVHSPFTSAGMLTWRLVNDVAAFFVLPVCNDQRMRILFIDDHIPCPELGVGYPRARNLLHALDTMGHRVVFAPLEPSGQTWATLRHVVPADVEVALHVTTANLHQFLCDRAGGFDLLLVSRPNNLCAVLAARPDTWRQVPILYDAEAIWATRTALQLAVQGFPLSAPEADKLLQDEVESAHSAAHVMAVSVGEAATFRERGCASVSVVSHGFATVPTPSAWIDRSELLFVGALDDEPSPNADALTWFVHDVMPLLQAQRTTPMRLRVAGRCAATSVRALAGPQVTLLGQVPDLADLFSSARVFVAPHRYASGIPTKVLEAAARGLPCVCSELLAAQLNWVNEREVLTARSAADFARAVLRLDTDPMLWSEIRNHALAGIAQRFNEAQFVAALSQALDLAVRAKPSDLLRQTTPDVGVQLERSASAAPRTPAAEVRSAWRQRTSALRQKVQHQIDAWRIARCKEFDRSWYLRLYADVAAANADPAMHYLLYGAAEGRDPGPSFSTMGYLSRYPEVARSGNNPLLHFVEFGATQEHFAGPRARSSERKHRVVFICGEPEMAGLVLRVQNLATAMSANGATTAVLTVAQAFQHPTQVVEASILVLWRTAWDDNLASTVKLARQNGACVLFDADDLVIEPTLARVEVIDGIRTQNYAENDVRVYFERTLRAFEVADWASCSTEGLAAHMRVRGKPTFVLPNGFSDDVHWRSRLALRRRLAAPNDGTVRIGYAAGTRTHQRDFAQLAKALVAVLKQRPQCRLVLFKTRDGQPLLDVNEFSDFEDLQAQIEWRDFVAFDRLADELARFDINIAPLQTGNPFCESKSAQKFVDAALVGVCTVASPTGPFAAAIEHGHSGFLAGTGDQWRSTLLQLVDAPKLRQRVADAAYRQVLWHNGPRRRADMAAVMLDQMLAPGRRAARTSALQLNLPGANNWPAGVLPEARVIFATDRLRQAEVTVVVPLHNYAQFIVEALNSVAAQTLPDLDLVVVDDASSDDSLAITSAWVQRHATRFNRVQLLQHAVNAGLGPTRNSAMAQAETPFALALDADDRLLAPACEKLLMAMHDGQADFVYPFIQQFGDGSAIMGQAPYSAQMLVGGNCISAIALIRKECWAAVGGYADIQQGWEDFDFWCKFVEMGMYGQQLPEVLAEYRVHGASMTHRITDMPHNKQALMALMCKRHPWLSMPQSFGVNAPQSESRTK